jgi:hypothetical protein
MHLLLLQLVETDDSLELGEPVGEVYVAEDALEVAVDDDGLRVRLEDLLSAPLSTRRAASPETLGTARVALEVQDEGYLEALEERLRKPDFRLALEVLGE